MFTRGFLKGVKGGGKKYLKIIAPRSKIDPITVRDHPGAAVSSPFTGALSNFGKVRPHAKVTWYSK